MILCGRFNYLGLKKKFQYEFDLNINSIPKESLMRDSLNLAIAVS